MLGFRMMHAVLLLGLLFTAVVSQSVCPNPIPMQVDEEDSITVLPQKTVCLQLTFTEAQRLPDRSAFFGYSASNVVGANPIQSLRATLYNATDSSIIGSVGPVAASEQSANLCLSGEKLSSTVWFVLSSQSDSNIYINAEVSALSDSVDTCNSASFSPFEGCDNPQQIQVNNADWLSLNMSAHEISCWFVSLTDEQKQGNVTIGLQGEAGAFGSVLELIATENGTSINTLVISNGDNIALVTYAGSQLPSEFYLQLTNFNDTTNASVSTYVNAPGVGSPGTAPSPAVSSDSDGGLGWWWLVIVLVVLVIVLVLVVGVFLFLKKRAANKDDYYADIS